MDTTATRESWKRLRQLVKNRDKSICYHCGKIDENGHCDHLIPLSKGGTDSTLNLVWSCANCNRKKGNKIIQSTKEEYDSIEIKKEDSIAKKIMWTIIKKWIIPPYPKYDYLSYPDYLLYFEQIHFLTLFPITNFLRKIIWPNNSPEVSIILDTLDSFNKISKQGVKITNLDGDKSTVSNYDLWKCAVMDSHQKIFNRKYLPNNTLLETNDKLIYSELSRIEYSSQIIEIKKGPIFIKSEKESMAFLAVL